MRNLFRELFHVSSPVEETYNAPSPGDLPEIIERTCQRCVWHVRTKSGKPTYMRIDRPNNPDADFFVVVVDAERLYRLWRHSPHSLIKCPLRSEIPSYRKLERIDEIFAQGLCSPVSLSHISTDTFAGGEEINIDDGATRAMWLLANGAKAFPVQTWYSDPAEKMNALIGCGLPVQAATSLLAPLHAATVNPKWL